jgi:hypothetical protein
MNTESVSLLIFGCLAVAVCLGMRLRRLLPEHHLSADSKEVVKLAMGLVATMTALLLGLLVSSAKGSYDAVRGEVIQMAAKTVFLDRVLSGYGPEAAETRARLHEAIQETIHHLWPEDPKQSPDLIPATQAGNAVYIALQNLSPKDDLQRGLKAQATSLAVELGQLRTLMVAQSVASISIPLLVTVIIWLFVIFLSFSLLAPPNATAMLALLIAALSVSGALFLILELDRPFDGLIRISGQPMLHALSQFPK